MDTIRAIEGELSETKLQEDIKHIINKTGLFFYCHFLSILKVRE